jgi:hypothetical protein
MDIRSLLCTSQQLSIDAAAVGSTKSPSSSSTTPYSQMRHQREPSWSSAYSCSSTQPDSPISSSSTFLYSIPSSPDIGAPLPPLAARNDNSSSSNTILNRSSSNSQTRIPWSNEEDQLLQLGYSQGLSWAMISTVHLPHRSRGCCWGRFKVLQQKSLEQREWNESEDRLLLLAMKKNSSLFKQAWKSVAQEMGNSRNWKECESRSSSKTSSSSSTITATTSHTIKKNKS